MTLHSYVRTLTLSFHSISFPAALSNSLLQTPPNKTQPLHKQQKKKATKCFRVVESKRREEERTQGNETPTTPPSTRTHTHTHTPNLRYKRSPTPQVSALLSLLPIFIPLLDSLLHRVPAPSAGISPAVHAGGPYPAIQPGRPYIHACLGVSAVHPWWPHSHVSLLLALLLLNSLLHRIPTPSAGVPVVQPWGPYLKVPAVHGRGPCVTPTAPLTPRLLVFLLLLLPGSRGSRRRGRHCVPRAARPEGSGLCVREGACLGGCRWG